MAIKFLLKITNFEYANTKGGAYDIETFINDLNDKMNNFANNFCDDTLKFIKRVLLNHFS